MSAPKHWSVKGVDQEARVRARHAADAAGMTIGAWVDRAILKEAVRGAVPHEDDSTPLSVDSSTIDRPDAAGDAPSPPNESPAPADERRKPSTTVTMAPPLGGPTLPQLMTYTTMAVVVIAIGAWSILRTPSAPQGSASVSIDRSAIKASPQSPIDEAAAAAVRRLAERAEEGDPAAQNDLGLAYAIGRGVARDDTKAREWFSKAAAQGEPRAQFNLGVMHHKGAGMDPDPLAALQWYRKAALQDHPMAQHNVGTFYGTGIGVPQDYEHAYFWLLKAAEAGVAASQYSLGELYEHGRGVERDRSKALLWYGKAATQGFAKAMEREQALITQEDAPAVAPRAAPVAAPVAAVGPSMVREIQRILRELDFEPGAVDGVMGRKTADAIRTYQRFAGLQVDGKATPRLLEELRAVSATVPEGRQP